MAGLCWVVVMLTLLLSSDNSVSAVSKKELADIVKFIMDRYSIHTQVSVAVNIPVKKTKNYLQEIFKKATPSAVNAKLSTYSIYPGDASDIGVVIAKPNFAKKGEPKRPPDHAESLVLENIKPLVDSSNGNFLVFYSFYSPCGAKCTNKKNEDNIIYRINRVIRNWEDYAFVFNKVFDKTGRGEIIDKDESIEALKQLGNSGLGRGHIFRCYKRPNKGFQCINCFKGKAVVDQCINNNA